MLICGHISVFCQVFMRYENASVVSNGILGLLNFSQSIDCIAAFRPFNGEMKMAVRALNKIAGADILYCTGNFKAALRAGQAGGSIRSAEDLLQICFIENHVVFHAQYLPFLILYCIFRFDF